MKVKLLRDVRPFGMTGETVEVSPDHFDWLTSLGMAAEVEDAREQAEKPEPNVLKKPAKTTAKKK